MSKHLLIFFSNDKGYAESQLQILSHGSHIVTGEMKQHLRETSVASALTSFVTSNEEYADVRDQVARLSSMIDSG